MTMHFSYFTTKVILVSLALQFYFFRASVSQDKESNHSNMTAIATVTVLECASPKLDLYTISLSKDR